MPVPELLPDGARAAYNWPNARDRYSLDGAGGLPTSICVDAPAPRERRKRSAAAEAAEAALAAAWPTGWAPAWLTSSEQQFPIAGATLRPSVARRRGGWDLRYRMGESAWGWELPQVASKEQVESWRRQRRPGPNPPETGWGRHGETWRNLRLCPWTAGVSEVWLFAVALGFCST